MKMNLRTDKLLLLFYVLHVMMTEAQGTPVCPDEGPVCYYNTTMITDVTFKQAVSCHSHLLHIYGHVHTFIVHSFIHSFIHYKVCLQNP